MSRGPLFVLVHGAWHDGWTWGLLRRELARLGYDSLAPDLPCDDPSKGVSEYADVVVDSIGARTRDVVVVGHSLGGLTAPVVAERVHASGLVLLCALLPQVGTSLARQRETDPYVMTRAWRENYLPQRIDIGETSTWPTALAREIFYHDCPSPIVEAALDHLRPQAATPILETSPLLRWPATTHYVYARDDRVVDGDWVEVNVRKRLGVDPIAIEGGHSPFFSQPRALADLLVGLVG